MGSRRSVVVLYMVSGELQEYREQQQKKPGHFVDGKKQHPNGFTLALKDDEVHERHGELWISAQTLLDGIPFKGQMKVYCRQEIPPSGRGLGFMWLLLQEPHEQILVMENIIQIQICEHGQKPFLPVLAMDQWWLNAEEGDDDSLPPRPNQDIHRSVSASAQQQHQQRKESPAMKRLSKIQRSSSIGNTISSNLPTNMINAQTVQETLQKTSQGLNSFARWAKKGLAAASDAMTMTESVQLQNRKVSVRKKLADGGFSEVFLVKDDAGQEYALKRCLAHSQEDIKELKKELDLHRKTEHTNVMKVLDYMMQPSQRLSGANEFYFLFPLYSHGSLYDQMDKALKNPSTPWPYPEKVAVYFMIGVVSGLGAIHRAGFTHRDIKPHNVLLESNIPGGELNDIPSCYKSIVPVLMDLGSAGPLKVNVTKRQQALMVVDEASTKCSAPYRAPELFEIPQIPFQIDEKIDIWSLGATLYAMTFGQMYSPFEHPTQGLQTLAIMQASFKFPSRGPGAQYSDAFKKLITQTLQKDPNNRPTLDQLHDNLVSMS